jgi:hypothetical protein
VSYDDAKDEYIDAITTELMEDPVMLPSSKQIVDRNTIGNGMSNYIRNYINVRGIRSF